MAGPQCCESAPHLQPVVGIGRVETFQHLSAYVTSSPDAKAAVILVSDIFGFEAPILRKLADKVAAAGYLVVVPDYFYGDPFVRGSGENPMAEFQDWIKNHDPAKGFEDSTKIIEVLKSRGISAIGAAGFCWGAKVVVELTKGEALKAGVLLHPSRVTIDDIRVVKAPIAILGAEIDKSSPPELVQQFGAILSAKPEVDSFVKIYPGVAHGWAVRYDENDEVAVKNAEEAHVKMLEWFNKYIN